MIAGMIAEVQAEGAQQNIVTLLLDEARRDQPSCHRTSYPKIRITLDRQGQIGIDNAIRIGAQGLNAFCGFVAQHMH